MREKLRLLTGLVGALLTLAVPTATCRAATTITVTSTGDIGSAGICVLPDAIAAAELQYDLRRCRRHYGPPS